MRKAISVLLLCITIIFSFQSTVHAVNITNSDSEIIIIDGINYYISTVITEQAANSPAPKVADYTSKTATKTVYIHDENQNVLWYLSITGTFSYNGTSSICTSCSHQAVSLASQWSIKSSSSNKGGNAANAIATAIYHPPIGIVQECSKSVTISCSPTGEIF